MRIKSIFFLLLILGACQEINKEYQSKYMSILKDYQKFTDSLSQVQSNAALSGVDGLGKFYSDTASGRRVTRTMEYFYAEYNKLVDEATTFWIHECNTEFMQSKGC